MSKVAVIYGSSRPSSKVGEKVANWFVDQVDTPDGVEFDMIDLAAVNLPLFSEAKSPMMGEYADDTTIEWSEQIKQYDGFVFVVAEYNLGYTPILKNAIDTLYAEWGEKAAAYISYGSYPKSTAVEQLKVVTSAFKMKSGEKTFHVNPSYAAFDEDGALDESKVVGDSAQEIADELFANL